MKTILYLIAALFPVPMYAYVMGVTPMIEWLLVVYLYGAIAIQVLSITAMGILYITWERWIVKPVVVDKILPEIDKLRSWKTIIPSFIPVVNSAILYLLGYQMSVVLFLVAVIGTMMANKLLEKKDGK